MKRSRILTVVTGLGALCLAVPEPAHADGWTVRAQASGGAQNSGYGYCGSSDGQVNCASTSGNASGSVTYGNGDTTITADGQAQGETNTAAISGGSVTADLSTVTIRQWNSSAYSNSGTSGLLADTLTFVLPDPDQVYAIPFSYNFDGALSGDTVGDYHPGLGAYSSLTLGYASVGSSQNIGESGPAYYPPVISLNDGSNQWINALVTPSMYGYSISGDVLVGGSWGETLAFIMNSSISCANEYGAASCDYSHTQAFDFGSLPSGVSYSSASGAFLTADQTVPGVPEPASWSLMLLGFGAVGVASRRRNRLTLAAAVA